MHHWSHLLSWGIMGAPQPPPPDWCIMGVTYWAEALWGHRNPHLQTDASWESPTELRHYGGTATPTSKLMHHGSHLLSWGIMGAPQPPPPDWCIVGVTYWTEALWGHRNPHLQTDASWESPTELRHNGGTATPTSRLMHHGSHLLNWGIMGAPQPPPLDRCIVGVTYWTEALWGHHNPHLQTDASWESPTELRHCGGTTTPTSRPMHRGSHLLNWGIMGAPQPPPPDRCIVGVTYWTEALWGHHNPHLQTDASWESPTELRHYGGTTTPTSRLMYLGGQLPTATRSCLYLFRVKPRSQRRDYRLFNLDLVESIPSLLFIILFEW